MNFAKKEEEEKARSPEEINRVESLITIRMDKQPY